ncbi:hypothetical protein [Paenibacillus terreus]|uniref:hypothetical protein n=1 Tax=Paenibacillus terreus TaxID=1387834 RepID=UPI0035CD09CD
MGNTAQHSVVSLDMGVDPVGKRFVLKQIVSAFTSEYTYKSILTGGITLAVNAAQYGYGSSLNGRVPLQWTWPVFVFPEFLSGNHKKGWTAGKGLAIIIYMIMIFIIIYLLLTVGGQRKNEQEKSNACNLHLDVYIFNHFVRMRGGGRL